MRILNKKEWTPYISDYLSSGWRKDSYNFSSIKYTDDKITGYVNISSYYLPSKGSYHFSVPLAFNIIAQLGIIHGCINNEIKKKTNEIYLREIQLKCKEVITSTKNIKIELIVKNKKNVDNGIFYSGIISIENSSFIGEAKYILPLI